MLINYETPKDTCVVGSRAFHHDGAGEEFCMLARTRRRSDNIAALYRRCVVLKQKLQCTERFSFGFFKVNVAASLRSILAFLFSGGGKG